MSKLYIKNSIPVTECAEPTIGEEYFLEDGHTVLYLGDEIRLMKQSPLKTGEKLIELEGEHVLKMFYALAKNQKI